MTTENAEFVDQPGTVRSGEELDRAALDVYLNRMFPDIAGDLKVEQYPGGASNLTYLVSKGKKEQ